MLASNSRFILRAAFSAFLFLSVLLMQGCGGGSGASATDACAAYWVSTSGSDATGDGSADHPFATIDRARLTVRNDARKGACRIDVNIRGGVYALTAPLAFDAQDSGSLGHEVVYQAAPGNAEPVVISGGLRVTGFQCGGARCVASVPELPAGVMPRQFYVGDNRAIRARSNTTTPINPDYKWMSKGFQAMGAPPPLTHPELVEAVTTTQWKMMRCPVNSYAGGTLAMADPCWSNANTFPTQWSFYQLSWLENAPEFLTEPTMWYLDPYAKTVTYLMDASTPPQNAYLPVLESLLQINGQASAPVTGLQFRNLEFAHATWLLPNSGDGYVSDQSGNLLMGSNYAYSAIGHQPTTYPTPGNIALKYARNVAFIGNTFKHLGGAAVSLGAGCQNNLIQKNHFVDISSSALIVGGISPQDMRPDAQSVNSGNQILDNVIQDTGRDYWDTAAIYIGFTRGTVVSHNSIHNVPWSGVAIGWGWGLLDQSGFPGLPSATPSMWGVNATPTVSGGNQITNNVISNFLEKLWDGGAIYTNGAQGTSFENGLLIQGNVAEGKRPGAGGNIFYTDGGSQYVTVNHNVALNDPVGTVDFGPCGYGTSFEGANLSQDLCLLTGVVPYGADMGGCLPAGNLKFTNNYFADPTVFFEICQNAPYVPATAVDVVIQNNTLTSASAPDVAAIVQNAGPR